MSDLELLIKTLSHQAKLHNKNGASGLSLLFTNASQELEKLQEENADLKKQSQWISVEDKPPTPYEYTEWDKTGDNCIFHGWISNSFELSDGSPYNFARGS